MVGSQSVGTETMLHCTGGGNAAILPSSVVGTGGLQASMSTLEAGRGDGLPASVWYESKIESESRTRDGDHCVALSMRAGLFPPGLVGGVCAGCMPVSPSRDGGAQGV